MSAQDVVGGPAQRGFSGDPLRAEIDRALFARRDGGDPRARDDLVERFLALARSIALRYQRSGEPFEDLLQVASLGLLKAVDGFDAARGVSFSSYAVPTIAGELKRYFRDRTWMVRPPRDLQELILQVEAATTELLQELDRAPTVPELARRVEVDEEQVLEALQARAGRGAVSFDAPAGARDDASQTLEDMLPDPEDAYQLAESRLVVDGLVTRLRPRTREILRLRFEEDCTQAEIGARLGISQMQVSRLIRQALSELRAFSEDPRLS